MILNVNKDEVRQYLSTADAFFERIFGMEAQNALLTDESQLSDFSFSGEGFSDVQCDSLNEAYRAWDAWVLQRIYLEYGLPLTKTTIRMTTLFAQLEAREPSTGYLH